MDIVIKLSQFLLSLSLLIILHELGHFIPAKLFKTRVEKFYLFFDVKYSLIKKALKPNTELVGCLLVAIRENIRLMRAWTKKWLKWQQ
jgi:regulator of sigma E protease